MSEKQGPVSRQDLCRFFDIGSMTDGGPQEQPSSSARPLEAIVQQVSLEAFAQSTACIPGDVHEGFFEGTDLKKRMYAQLTSRSALLESMSSLRSQFQTGLGGDPEVCSLFQNVPCPRITAVAVGKRYIHANYVTDGKTQRTFVASQLPNVTSLFWQFILEKGFDIIDLHTVDGGYAPTDQTEPFHLNTIVVRFVRKFDEKPDECAFEYEVRDTVSQKIRLVRRYHYTGWKDTYSVSVPQLQKLVSLLETTFQGNTLVHCHAGIGRTGTLIAAYFLKQHIQLGCIRPENLETALVDLIVSLREQRGPRFVSSTEQFNLLVDFALALFHP